MVIEYVDKSLNNNADLKKEIDYLNKCTINVFSGFKSKKQIKVNITTHKGLIYLITYKFKSASGSSSIYMKFHHYLRQREWSNPLK